MAKALLFIGGAKRKSKLKVLLGRFASKKLKFDYLFPICAAKELAEIGGKWILQTDFEEDELDTSNEQFLKRNANKLRLNIRGNYYITSFSDEIEMLACWAKAGVLDEDEFEIRVHNVVKNKKVLDCLFDTAQKKELEKITESLSKYSSSDREYSQKRANLKKISAPKHEVFKLRVAALLNERPLTLSDLAKELDLSKKACYYHMERMVREKLVGKLRKRKKKGRPNVLYDLRQKQLG